MNAITLLALILVVKAFRCVLKRVAVTEDGHSSLLVTVDQIEFHEQSATITLFGINMTKTGRGFRFLFLGVLILKLTTMILCYTT